MGDMDLDAVNPLTLSLDDVIKLNRYRNQQESQAGNESPSLSLAIKRPTKSSSVCEDEISVSNRLNGNLLIRNDLQAQRKSVHERLGWQKSYNQDKALRAIRNAQIFKNRIQNRRLNMDPSNVMPPPRLLRKNINQAKGNFLIQLKRASSVSSVSIKNSGHKTRHSLKKCLDPKILGLMNNLLKDENEVELQSADESMFTVDFGTVQMYKIPPCASKVPTNVRFKMNDGGALQENFMIVK